MDSVGRVDRLDVRMGAARARRCSSRCSHARARMTDVLVVPAIAVLLSRHKVYTT